MTTRTQKDIRAELGVAQKAARAETDRNKRWPLSQKVKALQRELSAYLSRGAEPIDGVAPVGLRHVHGRTVSRGGKRLVLWRHTFEIGIVGDPDRTVRISTPEEADAADLEQYAEDTIAAVVKAWNRKAGG